MPQNNYPRRKVIAKPYLLAIFFFFFLFAPSSEALTITGSETVTRGSNTSYSASGCNGSVSWSVMGTGASISANGALTAGAASCGSQTITARCSDGSTATKAVRVTDGGQWVVTESPGACIAGCGTPCWSQTTIGNLKYSQQWVCTNVSNCVFSFALNPQPPTYTTPCFSCGGNFPYPCKIGQYVEEWRCPSPACTNGQTIPCYTGTGGTQGVGTCKTGIQTCSGGQWGACSGQILPAAEICDNKDNNCNGAIDEGIQAAACYDGAAGTSGVGPCRAGTQTCTSGQWGACAGQILPSSEVCDGIDNNCNGEKDEGAGCKRPKGDKGDPCVSQ